VLGEHSFQLAGRNSVWLWFAGGYQLPAIRGEVKVIIVSPVFNSHA
jgi:hypothetical protein